MKTSILGKVTTDTTSDITNPILPMSFVNWYYVNASDTLTGLNPLLSQTVVNRTCPTRFECIHDYLIRINSFTSRATSSNLDTFQNSITTLGKISISNRFSCVIFINLK